MSLTTDKAHEVRLRYLGTEHYVIAIAANAEEAIVKARAALQEKTGMQVNFELLAVEQRLSMVAL